MTVSQQMVTIGMVILGTMFTRFLPFLLFPPGRPHPDIYNILGRHCPLQCLVCWSFIV